MLESLPSAPEHLSDFALAGRTGLFVIWLGSAHKLRSKIEAFLTSNGFGLLQVLVCITINGNDVNIHLGSTLITRVFKLRYILAGGKYNAGKDLKRQQQDRT